MQRLDHLWTRAPVATTIALTYMGLLLVASVNVFDPLVRHDDFPALLADPTGFYVKTLHEGRWLNYWWHLRGFVTPSWLNFLVYQGLWATVAGASAAAIMRDTGPVRALTLALITALAAPALELSFWFNTLIPGMAVLAISALLVTRLTVPQMRIMMLVAVPVLLMAYTTYPVFLLILILAVPQERSLTGLVATLAFFTASFALGVLLIYTLNYTVHGVFGVPMAEWRNPNPASDVQSALSNLRLVGVLMGEYDWLSSYKNAFVLPVFAIIFAAAFVISLRFATMETLYVVAGAATGIALVSLQIMLSGVEVGARALLFLWFATSIVIVRAATLAGDARWVPPRLASNAVFFFIATGAVFTAKAYHTASVWQADTRALAALVEEDGTLVVSGNYMDMPSATLAGIQHSRGLRLRLAYLTRNPVILCEEVPDYCARMDIAPPDRRQASVRRDGATTVLHLPGRG